MTPEELLVTLRPRHDLWNEPRFQDWLRDGEADIDELMKLAMTITKSSAEKSAHQAQILMKLGLEPPQSTEDSYQIFLNLRVVVNFWRRKLEQLKRQSDEYRELEKQLNAR